MGSWEMALTINKNIPIQIGTDINWSKVAAGEEHSMAIKTDGSLWGWGGNIQGELGNETYLSINIPQQSGTETDWKTVTARFYNSNAIKLDNSLYIWGRDAEGQIGDPTAFQTNVPILVSCGSALPVTWH